MKSDCQCNVPGYTSKAVEVTIFMYYVFCRIKDIIGYSADELFTGNGKIGVEFLHPAFSNIVEPMKNYCES